MLIKMLSLVICLVILISKVIVSDADNGFVTVSVNGYILNFVKTNRSVNYVGEANYNYEDGEDLYVFCEKDLNILDMVTLRLEYYNAEGTLLFRTLPGGTIESQILFRSQLKSINDKYYLDCIRAARDPEREYRYRTTFCMKKNAAQHAMILSVNGHKLTVIRNNGKPTDEHYLFRYIDGDILNVKCRKTDLNMRGSLKFFYDDRRRPVGPVVKSASGGSISVNISASNINRMILTCSIDNADIQNPNARLSFVSDISENDVRIRGLPTKNILYQYTNGLNRWTIEYQYTVNETLNLTCVSKGSPLVDDQQFQWEFNGKSTVSAALLLSPTMLVVAENIFLKILNTNHTGKIIRCVYMPKFYPNKTVEIILRLKSKVVIRESKHGEIVSGLENKKLSVDNDSKASHSFIVLGSSIATLLVVLAVTSAVALYCVRTKNGRRLIKIRKTMKSTEDPVHLNDSVYEIPNENDYQNIVGRHVVVSNNDTFNETRENVRNIDPEDHDYAEILDSHCRPGTQIRKIPVYNELHAH